MSHLNSWAAKLSSGTLLSSCPSLSSVGLCPPVRLCFVPSVKHGHICISGAVFSVDVCISNSMWAEMLAPTLVTLCEFMNAHRPPPSWPRATLLAFLYQGNEFGAIGTNQIRDVCFLLNSQMDWSFVKRWNSMKPRSEHINMSVTAPFYTCWLLN